MNKFIFILLLLCGNEIVFSQNGQFARADGQIISPSAIDSLVNRLTEEAGVTGITVGIINHNQPVFIRGYEYRNKEKLLPLDSNTLIGAASLSKSMFAYLIMRLVDKGIIDLDKPLYQYLPRPISAYEDYAGLEKDERWKRLTARHCLSHTTGFPNWRFFNPHENDKLEFFFEPGTRYAYSGEGIDLLQMVVESITGQSLEELALHYIFEPLGLINSSYHWQERFDSNYAVGHNHDEETIPFKKRKRDDAAGSLETTVADYSQLMAAVLRGDGLTRSSREEMLTPQIGIHTKHQFPSLNNDSTDQYQSIQLSYGLGWGLFNTPWGPAFFKEGHDDIGFQHYVVGIPKRQYALVLMTNSLNGESIFKELTEKIAGLQIPWEWEFYFPYRPVVAVPDSILNRFVGTYTGKTTGHIFLKNGSLMIVSEQEGLKETRLYAASPTVFFIKTFPLEIEFIENQQEDVDGIRVKDEGEEYQLIKMTDRDSSEQQTANFQLIPSLIQAYTGTYQLKDNPKRQLQITEKNNELVLILSKKEIIPLRFKSASRFKAVSILDIQGEFQITGNQPAKLIIYQDGRFEWIKVK